MIEKQKARKGVDTHLQRSQRACARHLRDLRRFHGRPPADVALRSVAVPKRIEPPSVSSYCTSPFELCAELMP